VNSNKTTTFSIFKMKVENKWFIGRLSIAAVLEKAQKDDPKLSKTVITSRFHISL
jgi:hypothetical protein